MADPYVPHSTDTPVPLWLLQAPAGQLSGDGQLHELIRERRSKAHESDADRELWYLPPALCQQHFGRGDLEAIISAGSSAATWLQLRFGGALQTTVLHRNWLRLHALALPPAAAPAPVGLDSGL